jgi:hypothetical protein
MRTSRLLIALVLGVASTCFAQVPTWTPKCVTNGPQAGYYSAMAYDSAHGQSVLFGGAFPDESTISNETWVWNGSTWTKQSPATNPPARVAFGIAYDSAHGEVVMFGGAGPGNGSFLTDTWLWDGVNWTPKANGPGPRLHMGMAYDAARQQVVMFGGGNGTPTPYGDTWVFDGSSNPWTQKFPVTTPGGRSNFRMAYDAARQQIIMFGGWNGGAYVNETWVWDGNTWTQKFPASSPSPRSDFELAYDANRGRVILFSGIVPSSHPVDNATWEWDGTNWTQDTPATSPSGRGGGATAYDEARGQIVMFGGVDDTHVITETWVWGMPTASSCLSGGAGTISVTTNMSTATFTVTGPGPFSGSGTSATFNNAPIGTYTITFGAVTGYITPSPQTQTLTASGTVQFSGTYIPSEPFLISSPVGLTFTYTAGQVGSNTTQSLSLSASSGVLTFTALASTVPPGGNWLSVVPGSGSSPAILNVAVAQNLGPGTYSGNITVTSSGGVTSPLEIAVSLIVALPGRGTAASSGRPILFVHGFCDDSASWQALRRQLASRLNQNYPTLYPDTTNYDVYYDGTTVNFFSGSNPQPVVPSSSARFFSIRFYDLNGGQLDAGKVAQVSILNKANELANVLSEITAITRIQDVIVIAHSMGGLVTRAYLEGMASILDCYDYNGGRGGSPDYHNGFCLPGGKSYAGEIADLVTIDTPHGGTDPAKFNVYPSCLLSPSTTKTEMIPGSQLLNALNYFDKTIATAAAIPSSVKVQSIESYFTDPNAALVAFGWVICSASNKFECREDGVVSVDHQSIELNLSPSFRNGSQFSDWGNSYTVEAIQSQANCQQNILDIGTVPILHFIQCVGAQLNSQSLVYSLLQPIVHGNLDSITVKATLDRGNGPVPWTGQVNYVLHGTDAITGQAIYLAGNAVPDSFKAIPVGTYTLSYTSGGPTGTKVFVGPIITILDSNNWNPTFTISFGP